jgi:hypothetical protein
VPDHLEIGTTPLAATGRVEQTWEGVLGRTYPDDVPPVIGPELPEWEMLPVPRTIRVGMLISGATRGEYQQRLADLAALVDQPASTLTLRRILTVGVTETEATIRVKFMGGLDPTDISPTAGRVVLRFQTLDADWTAVP